jgi:hypothetical protein
MQASRLLLAAAALTTAAFAAQADDADPSGQFAHPVTASATSAAAPVQAAAPAAGTYRVSPWSTQYNPLATFRSSKSRAEVQAEYIRSRDAVAAMNSEDSGSAYLAANRRAEDASRQLAGQPYNAQ